MAQIQSQLTARQRSYADALAQQTAARDKAAQDLKAAREALEKLERTLPAYEQAARSYSDLRQQGFTSELAMQEKQREAIEKSQDLKAQHSGVNALIATLRTEERKLDQVQSQYRSQLQTERTEVLGQIHKLEQDANKQGFRQGLLELRAPQAGIVQEVATNTVGAVVQPGTVLLTIVPHDESLIADVAVRNEDIGFVQVGQKVQVKLAAYPFQKFGLARGTVKTVLPDASGGSEAASRGRARSPSAADGSSEVASYRVIVGLDEQHLVARGKKLPLQAGMQVQADIVLGQRTIMEYLLSPMQTTLKEAARER